MQALTFKAHVLSLQARRLHAIASGIRPGPSTERTMNQTLLALDTPRTSPLDRTGFDIGWDFARHALVPPAELMLDGTPVSQGWHAARAVFGRRTLVPSRAVRQWLALRLQAWREGAAFEDQQLTPHYLLQLETSHCPVTRAALGGHPDGDHAPVLCRLRLDAGYAAGNLAMISRAAARAKAGVADADAARAQADQLARLGDDTRHAGLDAAAWARLATLMSFALPLPQAHAARLPLRMLPPNRVRVLGAAQGLQALLTLRLTDAGWARRARAVADLLPRTVLRTDFNLFVGAIAVPLMRMPADAGPREQRWAQEDAWADGRVQRRWQQFVLQLSEGECETLLQQLAETGLSGLRLLVHPPEAATDGWALPSAGRAQPAATPLRPAARQRGPRPFNPVRLARASQLEAR